MNTSEHFTIFYQIGVWGVWGQVVPFFKSIDKIKRITHIRDL